VIHDLLRRDGASARGEHIDRERDVIGGPRSRQRDVVAGRDRGAGDRRAELAGSDDSEAQIAVVRVAAGAPSSVPIVVSIIVSS
jgi:hypothetical protein